MPSETICWSPGPADPIHEDMTRDLIARTVRIRYYSDVPAYEVIVTLRGREMCLWCRDYDQAVKWARVECRSYSVTNLVVERVQRDQREPRDD
jgi:hypothetical protein